MSNAITEMNVTGITEYKRPGIMKEFIGITNAAVLKLWKEILLELQKGKVLKFRRESYWRYRN